MSLSAGEWSREGEIRDAVKRGFGISHDDAHFIVSLLDGRLAASRGQAGALAEALEFQRDRKPGLLPHPLDVLAAYRKGLG